MGCIRMHMDTERGSERDARARAHTSILSPCAETATPTRTPCQNLFLFTSCLHVLWGLWNLFLFLFFPPSCFFSPLYLTQMWVFLPFHNAFCSPFLLTCVRLGRLDIFLHPPTRTPPRLPACAMKPRCCFVGYGFYIFYSQPLIFLDLQIHKNSYISRLDMHTP